VHYFTGAFMNIRYIVVLGLLISMHNVHAHPLIKRDYPADISLPKALDSALESGLKYGVTGYCFIAYKGGAGADLAYTGIRKVTNNIAGYDVAPIFYTTIQTTGTSAIANYVAPDKFYMIRPSQIASFAITDASVAAGVYAYQEYTGKAPVCPPLPIPQFLREHNVNEQLITALLYTAAKIIIRTKVTDKLCGAPSY
jgi:hypothetical protein